MVDAINGDGHNNDNDDNSDRDRRWSSTTDYEQWWVDDSECCTARHQEFLERNAAVLDRIQCAGAVLAVRQHNLHELDQFHQSESVHAVLLARTADDVRGECGGIYPFRLCT